MIAIVLSRWFDRLVLAVILANCLFLAMDNEIAIITEYSTQIEMGFLILYTLEMVIKIIAMGFVGQKHAYLRDFWNCLDFFVVVVGIIGTRLRDQNVSAIRIIRILRTLRTITSLPGMASLVTTIVISLPSLFDIMILFVFTLVMFGTIAT